jgi:hypothetical protein
MGTILGTLTPVPHNFSNSKCRVGSNFAGAPILLVHQFFDALKTFTDALSAQELRP